MYDFLSKLSHFYSGTYCLFIVIQLILLSIYPRVVVYLVSSVDTRWCSSRIKVVGVLTVDFLGVVE